MSVFFRPRTERRGIDFSSSSWVPAPSQEGRSVAMQRPDTVEGALQVNAVWSCAGLLADTVSTMPLQAFRDRSGVKTRASDPQLLVEPAADMTPSEWLSQVMVSLLLRGNAYGRVVGVDAGGRPDQIELQHPDKVLVTKRDDGSVEYRFDRELVPAGQVWHLRGRMLPGAVVGLSPISYAMRTISVDAAAEDFGSRWFADGAHPSSVLVQKDAKEIDQATARTVKDRFLSAIRGTREPVVLSGGWEYHPIQVAANESQFLETQKWGLAQIARVFGIHPSLLGGDDGNSLTYSNVEQRNLDYLTYAVAPWLKRIEDKMTAALPRPQYCRFNAGSLLRTDLLTRYKAHNIAVASRFMTADEVRELEDLPPLTAEQKADIAATQPAGPVPFDAQGNKP